MAKMTAERYIKIYGERNSGTTYLRMLAQGNLQAAILPGVAPRRLRRLVRRNERMIDLYFQLTFARNLGWKHRIAPGPQELRRIAPPLQRITFLVITKNPYAWLLSLFRHPYHYRDELTTFERFLTGEWRTVGRENHPAPFANPIAMWNAKHASYLRLAQTAACRFVRYEDLLLAPEQTLAEISTARGIPRLSPAFVNVRESTKGEAGRDFEFYRRYYVEERWREELNARALETINSFLDAAIVRALGYAMIS